MTATSDEAKTLRWIDGFKELAPSEIRQISARCRWKWYRPDEFIVSQDDNCNDVFFIVQGRVRITNYTTSGKEVSFRDMTCGQIFGELAAIDGLPRSASAVSLSELAARIHVGRGILGGAPELPAPGRQLPQAVGASCAGAFQSGHRVRDHAGKRSHLCGAASVGDSGQIGSLANSSYADACRTRQPCSDSPRSSHAGRA